MVGGSPRALGAWPSAMLSPSGRRASRESRVKRLRLRRSPRAAPSTPPTSSSRHPVPAGALRRHDPRPPIQHRPRRHRQDRTTGTQALPAGRAGIPPRRHHGPRRRRPVRHRADPPSPGKGRGNRHLLTLWSAAIKQFVDRSPDNPSAASASCAIARAIGAASASMAGAHALVCVGHRFDSDRRLHPDTHSHQAFPSASTSSSVSSGSSGGSDAREMPPTTCAQPAAGSHPPGGRRDPSSWTRWHGPAPAAPPSDQRQHRHQMRRTSVRFR